MNDKTILIVDDDFITLQLLCGMLKGKKIITTQNPKEAIQIIQKEKIDIAIIDYRLPEMDGIELCSHLDHYYPNIVKVITTVEISLNTKFSERLKNVNVHSFLFKPLSKKIVNTTVDNIIQTLEYKKQLEQMVYYDQLTKLSNRTMFKNCLDKIVKESKSNEKTAILFLDLDGFKNVNDTFGHDKGDIILKATSKRLLNSVRGSDVVVSRQGGDEFTILLNKVKNKVDIYKVVRRILDSFIKPFKINNRLIKITTSIGVSVFPDDGKITEVLIKNADIAMYQAKNSGKNICRFYEENMSSKLVKDFTLENDLYVALDKKQISLHYQPQISLETNEVVGSEALIRWNHPELGNIRPSEFLPLAERNGSINDITKWSLKQIHNQFYKIRKNNVDSFISLNISSAQLQKENFIETIILPLTKSKTLDDLKNLHIEISENSIINNEENVKTILNELKNVGIKLVLDNFGTGYSSLKYLKQLPFDKVKIDKSLISNLKENEEIVYAIINLAHNLDLEVVAIGVENKNQLRLLEEFGCDYAQGFYIQKPLEEEQILDYIIETKIKKEE